jgi:hypothetical protein
VKYFLNTSGLPNAQVSELVDRIRRAGISVREVKPSFLHDGAIWVDDARFSQARQLLQAESVGFAEDAKRSWQAEWRTKDGRSYSRWLANRFARNPLGMALSSAMLGLVAGIFLIYPLFYALRRVI